MQNIEETIRESLRIAFETLPEALNTNAQTAANPLNTPNANANANNTNASTTSSSQAPNVNTTNTLGGLGETIANALSPGLSQESTLFSSTITDIGATFAAFNADIEEGPDAEGSSNEADGYTDNIAVCRVTQEIIDSLKPLKLAEIPHTDDDPLTCSICYDRLAEYTGQTSPDFFQNTDFNNNSNDVISPFEGYDSSDPSIMFPAIETATYTTAYVLNSELSLIKTDSEPVDSHYAVQLPQCNHVFGRSCIVEWLRSNDSCPLCRRKIEDTEIRYSVNQEQQQTRQQNHHNSRERTYVYQRAITESYVPIDWTCPPSSGRQMLDPPMTMPVPGIGMSTGRRTGRDPYA